jgi:hypothetical protein
MEAPQAIEQADVDFFFPESASGRESRDGHPYRIIIILNNIYHVLPPPKKNLSTTHNLFAWIDLAD